jgi:transposase
MERRRFTREFKLEAVRLIRDRGVSYAQASQDLKVHPTQLRNWVKAFADDPQHAFPGLGQMKPEQLEIARLKREVIRLKAERDILKNHRGLGPPVGRETAGAHRIALISKPTASDARETLRKPPTVAASPPDLGSQVAISGHEYDRPHRNKKPGNQNAISTPKFTPGMSFMTCL